MRDWNLLMGWIEIGKADGYEAPSVLCFVSFSLFPSSSLFLESMLNPFQPFHSAELGLKYVFSALFSSFQNPEAITDRLIFLFVLKTEDHGLKKSMQNYTEPKDRCSLHSPC